MAPSLPLESHLRSVAKGLSYRLFGTLFTAAAGFVMTGSTKTALLLGAAEFTFKVFLFWGHERLWARVRWGQRHRDGLTARPELLLGRAPMRGESAERLAPPSAAPVLALHASSHPIYTAGEG